MVAITGTVINGMRVMNVGAKVVTLAQVRPVEVNVNIPEMVKVEGGTFSMGSAEFEDAQPVIEVTVDDFAIGKYPVTNEEYLGYLQITGKEIPDLVANSKLALHPVVNVSWNDAVEYCAFLREITKTDEGIRKIGLPTEAQCEFAARGTAGRKYPWGNETYEGRVNFNTRGTTPVNKFPLGATPSGIFDMSGNVWEWVQNWYADTYNPNDLINPTGPKEGIYKVSRGGSWCSRNDYGLRAAYRFNDYPEFRCNEMGFRVSEDLLIKP